MTVWVCCVVGKGKGRTASLVLGLDGAGAGTAAPGTHHPLAGPCSPGKALEQHFGVVSLALITPGLHTAPLGCPQPALSSQPRGES